MWSFAITGKARLDGLEDQLSTGLQEAPGVLCSSPCRQHLLTGQELLQVNVAWCHRLRQRRSHSRRFQEKNWGFHQLGPAPQAMQDPMGPLPSPEM
jgi:hypothetical protein